MMSYYNPNTLTQASILEAERIALATQDAAFARRIEIDRMLAERQRLLTDAEFSHKLALATFTLQVWQNKTKYDADQQALETLKTTIIKSPDLMKFFNLTPEAVRDWTSFDAAVVVTDLLAKMKHFKLQERATELNLRSDEIQRLKLQFDGVSQMVQLVGEEVIGILFDPTKDSKTKQQELISLGISPGILSYAVQINNTLAEVNPRQFSKMELPESFSWAYYSDPPTFNPQIDLDKEGNLTPRAKASYETWYNKTKSILSDPDSLHSYMEKYDIPIEYEPILRTRLTNQSQTVTGLLATATQDGLAKIEEATKQAVLEIAKINPRFNPRTAWGSSQFQSILNLKLQQEFGDAYYELPGKTILETAKLYYSKYARATKEQLEQAKLQPPILDSQTNEIINYARRLIKAYGGTEKDLKDKMRKILKEKGISDNVIEFIINETFKDTLWQPPPNQP